MVLLRASHNRGFSNQRKALLAAVIVLLLAIGYAWYAGMAITRGVALRDMDWNGDGEVSRDEIAQAFYAVTVEDIREGSRRCRIFRWRRDGETIRKDCRTEVDGAVPSASSD